MAPASPHLAKHVQISALARFAPKSQEMRALIRSQLANPEYWGGLIAAEVFAEHFAEDAELRRHVIDQFSQRPWSFAAAALAELLLRKPDAEVEGLLRDRTAGVRYDIASHFKLVAALWCPEWVVKELEKLLRNIPLELYNLQLPRWVPAIVRRVERDAEVRAALRAGLAGSSASVKASFTSLLVRAYGVSDELQSFARTEVERSEEKSIPEVGFVLGEEAYRIVRHVLLDALL
jgi:hypothetical protein